MPATGRISQSLYLALSADTISAFSALVRRSGSAPGSFFTISRVACRTSSSSCTFLSRVFASRSMSWSSPTSSGRSSYSLLAGGPFSSVPPGIIAHDLPSPHVGRRPRHAVPLGDFRGSAGPRLQLCDDSDSLLDGDGVPLGVRAALLPLAGRQLVDPLAQRHAAFRIAERPHRPGQALAVLQVVVRGGSGLPVGVHRLAMAVLADGDLAGRLVLLPPRAQGVPVGKAQRGDGVGDAVVKFDVSFYGELPLLLAVHAASFLVPFWSRIPAAVPSSLIPIDTRRVGSPIFHPGQLSHCRMTLSVLTVAISSLRERRL